MIFLLNSNRLWRRARGWIQLRGIKPQTDLHSSPQKKGAHPCCAHSLSYPR